MAHWLWSNVQYGQGPNNSVKIVQEALNKYAGAKLTVDGVFGDKTAAAYKKWQQMLGYTGSDADGRVGPTSLKKLGEKAGFTVKQVPAPPKASASNYATLPEPSQDMTRVYWGGKIVNKRTAVLLDRAVQIFGRSFTLTQGSYNAGGVAASAGTHDGGGAGDVNVSPFTAAQQLQLVQALRKAGFAAWRRVPAEGFAYHIHFEAIGDKQLSSGAAAQVQSYFNGRNGLVSNARVTDALHWPNWADKYNK